MHRGIVKHVSPSLHSLPSGQCVSNEHFVVSNDAPQNLMLRGSSLTVGALVTGAAVLGALVGSVGRAVGVNSGCSIKNALQCPGNPSKHFDPLKQLSSDTHRVSKLHILAACSYVLPQNVKYFGWSNGTVGDTVGVVVGG